MPPFFWLSVFLLALAGALAVALVCSSDDNP
jgi:hypothetical protein